MNAKEFLGVELPIIQAPMAGVQDSDLTIAVSSAGGLGSLPCAMLELDMIDAELNTITENTDKSFNVNFFCHTPPIVNAERESRWRAELQPYFTEYHIDADSIPAGASREPFRTQVVDVLEKYKPKVVSFHFGLPERKLLTKIKSWGTKILASATTIEEARWLEAHGADGIIAQGLEAGGHRGMFLTKDLTTQVGTLSLLPQIIQNVSVPVVAAGGICNAQGVTAALSLGAIAVQVGTAYLLCSETKTSQLHRAAIKSQTANHTAITNIFSGRPARSIVNRAVKEIGPINTHASEFPLAATSITALRKEAESKKCSDFSPLWCGQNASGCKEVSASALTKELAAGL